MTLQVWGGAVLLVAAAALIAGGLRAVGIRCRASGPAVGLSVLIVLADIAIKLPGRAVTAVLLTALALICAGVLVARRYIRERDRTTQGLMVPLATLLVAAGGAAIPFVANGRVGLLGVSLDNDTANHLLWAETLRSPVVGRRYGALPSGYPLGPHSLVDVLGTGVGIRLDLAFTALLIATVLVTALVAAAALRGAVAWKRVATGGLGALVYLIAAYYGEASFKETLLGLFLLATVLQLEEVRADWVAQRRDWRTLIPVSLLFAGALSAYSYTALAWLALTIAIWLGAELIMRPGRLQRLRPLLSEAAVPVGVGLGVLVVLLLPDAGRILSFVGTVGVSPAGTGAIASSNLGNLIHALSPYEALGIWNSVDFRLLPANVFHAGELSAFALVVLLFGVVWEIRKRELVLPAAIAACAIVAWVSRHGQSPYVSAKALVIASPVVAVVCMRGLLSSPERPLARWAGLTRLAAAIAFLALAAHSSYEQLRDVPVWPQESTSELLALSKLTRGENVLFLGASDYAAWLFKNSDMSALASTSVSEAKGAVRPNKPAVYGTAIDFDSVDPSTINRFQWVVAPNTSFASAPPDGMKLVRTLPLYQLWRRVGFVAPRQVIEPSGAPGAVLDCQSRSGRALSKRHGVAATMAAPIVAPLAPIAPGGDATVELSLPAGLWDLSVQYTSALPLEVLADGEQWRLPAYLDRPGPFFSVGTVSSVGQQTSVEIRATRPSFLTGPGLISRPTSIAAVRRPDRRVLIPLSQACGRYVDWYRLAGQ